jgi:hypothetical protein
VATPNQKKYHTHFEFSQTTSIFQTNTTTVCQTLFKTHPRKSLAKFKFKSHAAISSNTWQA